MLTIFVFLSSCSEMIDRTRSEMVIDKSEASNDVHNNIRHRHKPHEKDKTESDAVHEEKEETFSSKEQEAVERYYCNTYLLYPG